jgi:Putative transposase
MMRNVFSTENINYTEKTGKVIYRTGKLQGKHKLDRNKKNFSLYDAEEFIAAITQHILKKSFQMIRY